MLPFISTRGLQTGRVGGQRSPTALSLQSELHCRFRYSHSFRQAHQVSEIEAGHEPETKSSTLTSWGLCIAIGGPCLTTRRHRD